MVVADEQTLAALRHMLQGDGGSSRSGKFMVEVHGGRIVSVSPIGPKQTSNELSEATKPDAPTPPLGRHARRAIARAGRVMSNQPIVNLTE